MRRTAPRQKALALQIAYDNLQKSTDALNKYQQTQVTQSDAVATATQAIYDKVAQANQALQTAIQVYNGIRQATIDGAASQAAYNDAWNNLLTAFKNANPEMATAKGGIQDVGAAAMKAAQADDSWTGSSRNPNHDDQGRRHYASRSSWRNTEDGGRGWCCDRHCWDIRRPWGLMDITIPGSDGTIKNVVQTLDQSGRQTARGNGQRERP